MRNATDLAGTHIRIPLGMLNRHGLVAGATGTGKTKTLQLLAEQLSANGVPVFAADIKGDLSGMSAPGEGGEKIASRAASVGQQWTATSFPVEFYALGGQGTGIPLRVTMTAFGPILLSKVLGLNDTQESSLGLVFHYADQKGLPLLDLADLRAVVQWLTSDEGKADLKLLGGLSAATAGVILRELIGFQDQGAEAFFGEPEFESSEFLQTTPDGRGLVNLVELPNLQDRPAVFSTFLMWLLADLFHDLPEVGDIDKPKLVFFFDEAHLLFNDASKAFLDQIAQTVRLIRSKGVGVFFVTQSPDRRTRQRARPARLPHPAPAARPHAQRRQGAQADRQHLPQLRLRRPRRGDHQPRDRRGRRHRDERARRPDPRRLDPAARTRVADGPGRPRRHAGDGQGQPALRQVLRRRRPRLRPRDAHRQGRGGRPTCGRGSRRQGAREGRQGSSQVVELPLDLTAYVDARTTAASSRTSSSPAPSRTSCVRRPARSRAGCSAPAGAERADRSQRAGSVQAIWTTSVPRSRVQRRPRPGGTGWGLMLPISTPSSGEPDSIRPGMASSRIDCSTGSYDARPAPPERRATTTCRPTSRDCAISGCSGAIGEDCWVETRS